MSTQNEGGLARLLVQHPLGALDGGLTGGCSGNSTILGSRCSKADSYHSPVLTPVRWHDKGLQENEYGVILPPKFLYHYFVTFSKKASLAVCRGSSATCRLKSGAGNLRFTPLAKIRFCGVTLRAKWIEKTAQKERIANSQAVLLGNP